MTWRTRGRDHSESQPGGRFDVFRSACDPAVWVAIDSDYGRKVRRASEAEAKRWCEERAAEREASR